VWNVNPGHPISEGIGDYIELPESEMYGEPFGIPTPDEQVFISWFQGGEIFRGGNCWTRGSGRIFYFSPGHELYPVYHNPQIQRVIYNAVKWARAQGDRAEVLSHVPVENAPEKIAARGPVMNDASGKLIQDHKMNNLTRRIFINQAGPAGMALAGAPAILSARSPNDKLN